MQRIQARACCFHEYSEGRWRRAGGTFFYYFYGREKLLYVEVLALHLQRYIILCFIWRSMLGFQCCCSLVVYWAGYAEDCRGAIMCRSGCLKAYLWEPLVVLGGGNAAVAARPNVCWVISCVFLGTPGAGSLELPVI